nr:shikimate kinase [Lachnospiraceae bacterium]
RRLSYRLKMPYVDTDKLIEKKQMTTISHIFETQGEEAFRDMETDCLKSLFENKQDYVIAVGGGLVLREENRALIRELGKAVYLRAKPETIYERLKDDTSRPLLQCEDPQGKIGAMIKERGPVYESAAKIVIDVDGKRFEEILDEIEKETAK